MLYRLSPIATALLVACASGAVDKDVPQYSLYSGPRTYRTPYGPAEAAWTALPFNRTYSQLTEEQKERFKSLYVGISKADEPPYPAEGLVAIYGPIAEAQARLGVEGVLDMEVSIDTDGQATQVEVFKTPSKKASDFVAHLAVLTKFKPGICGGRPCKMAFPIKVTFKVE